MKKYRAGPKPIRTQLCICLAQLAIRMTEWKDVLPTVISAIGSEQASISCLLEFLKILPEEVTEGRKFNLSVRPSAAQHYSDLAFGPSENPPACRYAITV